MKRTHSYPEVALPPEIESVAHRVIGCAIEVHRRLGPGLLEKIYEDALAYELQLQGLRTERQVEIAVHYRDTVLRGQRLDLLVEGAVIVEAKAVADLVDVHAAQLLSYLRASDLPLGLLMNFNVVLLKNGTRRVCNERSSMCLNPLKITPPTPLTKASLSPLG